MEKKREELLKGSILKLFVKYFIPTLIGSAAVVLYNIVDRFFVGKISEKALAGAGIAFYIVMLIIAFSMFIGVGAGTIISIRLGQGKKGEAKKILGNAVTLFAILGLLLYAFLILNIDTVLRYSGANNETLPYARAYLEIILCIKCGWSATSCDVFNVNWSGCKYYFRLCGCNDYAYWN